MERPSKDALIIISSVKSVSFGVVEILSSLVTFWTLFKFEGSEDPSLFKSQISAIIIYDEYLDPVYLERV